MKQLASYDFIDRHENVVIIGDTSTGKTHLMPTIGFKACLKGFSALFYRVTSLITKLKESQDTYNIKPYGKDD